MASYFSWLRQLDKEYSLTTEDYTIDDFIDELLNKGFISTSDSSLEPIYEELDGWEEDIFEITNYETLPTNFKNYIDYLETKLNVKIKIVSRSITSMLMIILVK